MQQLDPQFTGTSTGISLHLCVALGCTLFQRPCIVRATPSLSYRETHKALPFHSTLLQTKTIKSSFTCLRGGCDLNPLATQSSRSHLLPRPEESPGLPRATTQCFHGSQQKPASCVPSTNGPGGLSALAFCVSIWKDPSETAAVSNFESKIRGVGAGGAESC